MNIYYAIHILVMIVPCLCVFLIMERKQPVRGYFDVSMRILGLIGLTIGILWWMISLVDRVAEDDIYGIGFLVYSYLFIVATMISGFLYFSWYTLNRFFTIKLTKK